MFSSKERIDGTRDRFRLLRRVHPRFCKSLSNNKNLENWLHEDIDQADLANDISLFRTDFRFLIDLRLGQIDIDQVTNDNDLERLASALTCMLGLLEESISEKCPGLSDQSTQHQNVKNAPLFSKFPKLVAFDISKQQSVFNIEFRCPRKCRNIVNKFGDDVAKVFPANTRAWDADVLLDDIKVAEIEYIQEAHEFSKISSSLFSLLVDCINSTCQADHVARLHLFGFHKRQMEMLLGTAETFDHDWISACFTHCVTPSLSAPGFSQSICTHETTSEDRNRKIQGLFNGTALWENCDEEHDLSDFSITPASPSTLHHLLQTLGTHQGRQTTRPLDSRARKVIGVLLAYALFQLRGSPWLQCEFQGGNILVLPGNASGSQHHLWRPHVSCDLNYRPGSRFLYEDVAALGILILELEANREAQWTGNDEDQRPVMNSNRARLYRILTEWEGDLPDIYHGVGYACFEFESLVENFDHAEIDQSMWDLVVLYKCIVNPLFRQLVSDFSDTEGLFRGISSLSVPTRPERDSTAESLVLYDDEEFIHPDEKSGYADILMKTWKSGFLGDVKALRNKSTCTGVVESSRTEEPPKRIRIAVLDTGIDMGDIIIRTAMEKGTIPLSHSWVGDSCQDTCGHGTHVTRLLMSMAPFAEFYVAKIADSKTIDRKDMGRIAEAIDWALDECGVDIISMSFGFEHEHDAIDHAINRAFKADKLMFVAASNEGGNKIRSRLGRSPFVICIHACDGKGNKGAMSPTQLPRRDNFTTLGIGIKSTWAKKTVYKSGTSFATPVAAGIAANILEFANFSRENEFAEKHRKLLRTREGMAKVFEAMSESRDGYDYVQPGRLWDGKNYEDRVECISSTLRS